MLPLRENSPRTVRSRDADDVLEQVRALAALPATDEDDDRVCGLFLVFHEKDRQFEWQVRDGDVFISPAAACYDYLWR